NVTPSSTQVRRFHESGSVRDRPRSGRPRSVRIDAVIDRVRDSVSRDPSLSTRKRSRALNVSRSSLMRIQQLDLHLRAYKVQSMHALTQID
ncbi:hypothetical protein EAI_05563, partial [Harpegnathos saltator]